MEVAVERPVPVKEEKRVDAKPDMATAIAGSATPLPIVFESFTSAAQSDAGIKQEERKLEATKAEMGEVREENERLKTMLSRIINQYQSLQTHFLDVVKVHEQAAKANKLPAAPPAPAVAPAADDVDDADELVSLSLGTRSNGTVRRKGHERSSSSSAGTAETTTADDEGNLSLGLGIARRRGTGMSAADDDKASGASVAAAPGGVQNLSSDSSSADDTAKQPAAHDAAAACPTGTSRKSPSAGAGEGADDEVQQQAKKARVSVRVKCDTPTMPDGCQWRKYGQKISKGNPCPRAYYRCTVAPQCPVRKQVQRCAEDTSILITTYEGQHNHNLPPAATAMASTTSAAAAMLTSGSTTSSSAASLAHAHHHLPLGLLGPTTMVSTATSCPTITLDLTAPPAPQSLMHSASPYAGVAGYESKAVPASWSTGYMAYGGAHPSSYYGVKTSPALGHLFGGGGGMGVSSRPEQMYGAAQSYLQRTSSLGGVAPAAVTDTLAKAITADPSFQSALAAAITSVMGRGGAAAAQK